MTPKEYCESHKSIAYYSGFNGLEIKGIEYGIEDYVYCVSNCWHGGKRNRGYHCLKVRYDKNGEAFVQLRGYHVLLSECIRM